MEGVVAVGAVYLAANVLLTAMENPAVVIMQYVKGTVTGLQGLEKSKRFTTMMRFIILILLLISF